MVICVSSLGGAKGRINTQRFDKYLGKFGRFFKQFVQNLREYQYFLNTKTLDVSTKKL